MGLHWIWFTTLPEKKAQANLNIWDLDFISGFAEGFSEELSKRMKDAREMLKGKALENWNVDVDSERFKEEIVKPRTWVSSDPKMAEVIRRAREIDRAINGMVVVIDLTKEELEYLINRLQGFLPPENPYLRKLRDTYRVFQ